MSDIRAYKIIRRPLINEKSTLMAEKNQMAFETSVDATKKQIRKAVEALFKVEVVSVNTVRMKGKTKRFRLIAGRRKMRKKAIVRVKEGQSIDMSSGGS